MSERLKSMQRIVAVQAQRKRLAEWKLAAIEGHKAAIAAARIELDAFVEDATPTGPLASLALAQTRRMAERAAATEAECDRQRSIVHAAERRHRLAERVADEVAAADRMLQERRDLERLIEGAVARAQQNGSE